MDWGQLFALLYIILGSPIRGEEEINVFKFKTRESAGFREPGHILQLGNTYFGRTKGF